MHKLIRILISACHVRVAVSWLMLACLCSAAQAADTGKIVLKISDDTVYDFKVPDAYRKVTTDKNGKVTVRALMTLRLLRIPDDYTKSSETPIKEGESILGLDFPEVKEPDPGDYDVDGALTRVRPIPPATSLPAASPSKALFKAIRHLIPRSFQSTMNGTSLLARAVDTTGANGFFIKDSGYAFMFADSLTNSRAARALALKGNAAVDPSKTVQSAIKNLKEVKLLKDVAGIGSASAELVPLSLDNLRNYGQWTFNDCVVTSAHHPEIGAMHMVEVNVAWALEATIDPASPPTIPLGKISTLGAAETIAASSGSGGSPDNASAGQKAGASVQPSPLAPGLLGQVAGFSVSQLAAFGAPGGQIPGVDVVGGFAIKDNGTPTMFGANVTFTGSDGKNEIKGKLFDWSRVGALIGRTTDQRPAYIIGPSLKINPSSILYMGYGFSDSNGLTRSGAVFGAAFNLLAVLPGAQGQSKSATSQDFDFSIENGKLLSVPGVEDTNAAVLWSEVPSETAVESNSAWLNSSYTQTAVKYDEPFPLASHGSPDTNGKPHGPQYFWIQYVKPGELNELAMHKDLPPAANANEKAPSVYSDFWTHGDIFLYDSPITTSGTPHEITPSNGLRVDQGKVYSIAIRHEKLPIAAENALPAAAAHSAVAAQPDDIAPMEVEPLPSAAVETESQPEPARIAPHGSAGHPHVPSGAHAHVHPSAVAMNAAAPPAARVAGDSARGLHGRFMPPVGVKPDEITFTLSQVRHGAPLTSANAAFILRSSPYDFTWDVPEGVYWLQVVKNGDTQHPLLEKQVSTGSDCSVIL